MLSSRLLPSRTSAYFRPYSALSRSSSLGPPRRAVPKTAHLNRALAKKTGERRQIHRPIMSTPIAPLGLHPGSKAAAVVDTLKTMFPLELAEGWSVSLDRAPPSAL